MTPYLLQRIWRRRRLSICSLVLCAVLCFLMSYLSGYQQELEVRLEETKTRYDILCVVTDRRGSRSTSLRMNRDVVDFVMDESAEGLAPYVRDLRITKEFSYTGIPLGLHSYSDLFLTGVSSEKCAEVLDPETDGQVTYFTDDFYGQDGCLCLVSEALYEELGTDTLSLLITDPFVSQGLYEFVGRGTVEFQIAGYYAGGGHQIYISFAAAQRLGNEISGGLRSADSISFIAADNTRLDEIYAVAATYFGIVDPNAGDKSIPKVALTVHDEQYRATIAAMEQNILRINILMPLLLLLGFGMGFLISFLATRGEKRTYALMRTIGLTRGKLLVSILLEQTLLPLLAAVVIGTAMANLLPSLLYLLCHCTGCAAVAVRAVRVPPTAILREQE